MAEGLRFAGILLRNILWTVIIFEPQVRYLAVIVILVHGGSPDKKNKKSSFYQFTAKACDAQSQGCVKTQNKFAGLEKPTKNCVIDFIQALGGLFKPKEKLGYIREKKTKWVCSTKTTTTRANRRGRPGRVCYWTDTNSPVIRDQCLDLDTGNGDYCCRSHVIWANPETFIKGDITYYIVHLEAANLYQGYQEATCCRVSGSCCTSCQPEQRTVTFLVSQQPVDQTSPDLSSAIFEDFDIDNSCKCGSV